MKSKLNLDNINKLNNKNNNIKLLVKIIENKEINRYLYINLNN